MHNRRQLEFWVGCFMIIGALALVFLALKVSGLTQYRSSNYYPVTAEFDNVGDLKVRAPVRVAGVRIGEVGAIQLDPSNFRAKVILLIDNNKQNLPVDTSASIFTQGLLGANYVNLTPGYETTYLQKGGVIENTNPALILEKLIGQLLFSLKDGGDKDTKKDGEKSNAL